MRTGILLLFIFCVVSLDAQTTSSVEGYVKDSAKVAVPFAAISLVNANDSSLVKGILCDESGYFNIENVNPGKYFLIAQAVSFQKKYSSSFDVESDQKKKGDIILTSSSANLKEVEVAIQKPFIEHFADKIVVNVENSIVSAGSNVYEVLERSPGVSIDQDGNISLKGKQGVNVMMDGKSLRMSEEQLANFLKSLPASTIERIDLISNPSAKYDAEGTAGIIDIKTKKGRRDGFNATVYASYGQGRYPKAGTGLNFNARKNKMNWYGGYDFSSRKDFYDLHLDRIFYSDGIPDTRYIQHNYVTYPINTHTAKLGCDYSASKKTTVGFLVNGSSNHFSSTGSSNSDAMNGSDEIQYYYSTASSGKQSDENISANVNLRHSIDTTGSEFTSDLDFAVYKDPLSQNFTSNYTDINGNEFLPPSYVRTNVDALLKIYSAKMDYVTSIKNIKIESGAKSSYVTADNDKLFYNTINGIDSIDLGKTNHFLYDENINAAYLILSHDIGKFSISAGLRGEQTSVHGNQITNSITFSRNYFQLFPSANILFKANDIHQFTVGYSRRINRPNYQSLNPFIMYVDPTFYKSGNPYLVPELNNTFELDYSLGEILFMDVFYSHAVNNIGVVLLQDDVKKITIQTDQNNKYVDYFGTDIYLTLKPFKWWNSVTSFSLYNGKYVGSQQDQNFDRGNYVFSINSTNSFILPAGFTAEFTYYYKTKEVYGILDVKEVTLVNLGLKKLFMKNKLSVKVNCTDLLYANNSSGVIKFYYIDENFTRRRDTRMVNVTLSYNIGKGGTNSSSRRLSGAEEEKKRAGEKSN